MTDEKDKRIKDLQARADALCTFLEVRYGDWVVVDDGFNVLPFPCPEFTEQALHFSYRDESNVEIESRRCWGSREIKRGMEIWEDWVLYDTEEEARQGWTED